MKRKFEFTIDEIPLIIGLHLSNLGVELRYDERLFVSSVVDKETGKLVRLIAEIIKM